MGYSPSITALSEVSWVFLCSGILSRHPPKPLQLQNILLRQQTESKLGN